MFELALLERRPAFIDYFFRHYYNPLRTTGFNKFLKDSKQQTGNNYLIWTRIFNSFFHRILIHVVQQRWQEPNTYNANLSKKCREYALNFIIKLYTSTRNAAASDVSLLRSENWSLCSFCFVFIGMENPT